VKWLSEMVYIFGSLVQPHWFRRDSDVDVAVEQINTEDNSAITGFLLKTLQREVDVIKLRT